MGVDVRKRDGARRKKADKERLGLFGRLAPVQQDKLIAFAEFFAVKAPGAARAGNGKSARIARPARETVAMAVRRLVRSYPMLDRRQLLAEGSQLLAQHALGGRPAVEVIDDLEKVFAQHYRRLQKRGGRRDEG